MKKKTNTKGKEEKAAGCSGERWEPPKKQEDNLLF